MREIIYCPVAPASNSPVSQATIGAGLIFIGGQMPRDLDTGEIVSGEAILFCTQTLMVYFFRFLSVDICPVNLHPLF